DWDYLRDWAKATNSAVNEQFAVRVESLQVDPTVPTEEVTREIVELTNLSKKISDIQAAAEKPDKWVLYQEPFAFEVKPIHLGPSCYQILHRHAAKKLYMSATILDYKDMAITLGLDPAEVEYLELPSTFPAENRPVNYWPVAKVKGQELEKCAEKITEAIDRILEMFPQEKGVIHTVSNSLTKEVISRTAYEERMVHHLDRPREEAISEFLNSEEPLVLVSPSVTIGLDLPDDAGRFQIIAKLQFPNLGDPLVQAKMQLSDSWYAVQTARALVQATGRIVRHKNDRGTSFILDKNCDWFFRRYSTLLPYWWAEALYPISNLKEAKIS
ncbi:MAG: helicase C-terminal domain-containing protein, partial [Candidatus Freyarchaeota archaeon]